MGTEKSGQEEERRSSINRLGTPIQKGGRTYGAEDILNSMTRERASRSTKNNKQEFNVSSAEESDVVRPSSLRNTWRIMTLQKRQYITSK